MTEPTEKQPAFGRNGEFEHCIMMFELFDETDGEKGWDHHRINATDNKYILSVCANDPLVGPYASVENGGHPSNKNDKKLFQNYKVAAGRYAKILPDDWNDEIQLPKFLSKQEKSFITKYVYDQDNNGAKDLIGKGSFGKVFKGTTSDANRKVAIKVPIGINNLKTAEEAVLAAIKEVRIWKQVSRSPFVLDLLDHFVLKNENDLPVVVTVTPWIEDGTLHKRIVDLTKLPPMEAWLVSYQLSLAVNYMHGFKICHRDIKPPNILIVTTPSGALWKILVIDLGLARRFASTHDRSQTVAGTDWFMAPEVAHGNYTMEIVDAYSVGRTILVSALGYYPGGYTRGMFQDQWDDAKVRGDNKDDDLVQVALKMVHEEPGARWALPDVLNYLPKHVPEGRQLSDLHHKDIKEAAHLSLKQASLGWVEPFLSQVMVQTSETNVDDSTAKKAALLRNVVAALGKLKVVASSLEADLGLTDGDVGDALGIAATVSGSGSSDIDDGDALGIAASVNYPSSSIDY